MKKLLVATVVALSAATATGQALAGRYRDFVDTARVISVTPVYETVRVARPVEECWTEEVVRREYGPGNTAGTIAGGIVGGVLGNQFGHGRGNAAMTVAGTLLGATIANDMSRQAHARDYVTRERRCATVDRYETEERLLGYDVEYRYRGKIFVTRTREHPGTRIPVRVAVEPVRDY
jgi:uncharacterized protein YcfJ